MIIGTLQIGSCTQKKIGKAEMKAYKATIEKQIAESKTKAVENALTKYKAEQDLKKAKSFKNLNEQEKADSKKEKINYEIENSNENDFGVVSDTLLPIYQGNKYLWQS